MIISDIQNLPLDISFKKLYASPKTPKAKMTAYHGKNKANLRDLIAATGLVILLKLDSNRRFFIKLRASSQTPGWIKTGVTVRKRSIRVKIADFLSRVTLKFDGWPWKTTGHLFYATLSFMHHFKAISEFKLELQSGNAQFGSKSAIFYPMWPWNLMDHLEKL